MARRFTVVPVGQTDSYLDIATSNPFDLDAEKMLAFATGREVRMLLGTPAVIRQRIDEHVDIRAGPRLVARVRSKQIQRADALLPKRRLGDLQPGDDIVAVHSFILDLIGARRNTSLFVVAAVIVAGVAIVLVARVRVALAHRHGSDRHGSDRHWSDRHGYDRHGHHRRVGP